MSLAPNGNGGVLAAIKANKEAYELVKGTDYVQFLSVDNVLNAVLDPLQIGHAIDQKLQCSLKSCDKRDAEENVGVIGKKNGKYNIIEYFEMAQEMREQTEDDGKTLKHRQSYLLMVVLDTNFLLHLLE